MERKFVPPPKWAIGKTSEELDAMEGNGNWQIGSPATIDQQAPDGADSSPDICTLVQNDLEARAQKGLATYGQRLKPHNGRDALVDAYQEALDLCMYLRQAIEERDT
jgi:hypothetical protein